MFARFMMLFKLMAKLCQCPTFYPPVSLAKELKNKYEAIPMAERSVAHTGFPDCNAQYTPVGLEIVISCYIISCYILLNPMTIKTHSNDL